MLCLRLRHIAREALLCARVHLLREYIELGLNRSISIIYEIRIVLDVGYGVSSAKNLGSSVRCTREGSSASTRFEEDSMLCLDRSYSISLARPRDLRRVHDDKRLLRGCMA